LWLTDVGLGNLHLGQLLSTSSGGGRRRLKLTVHLCQEDSVIIVR